MHFGILISRADVARKFKPVAIGVKEINGLEYAVTCRANYINAPPLDMKFGGQQRVKVRNLKRNMLHPIWRIGVFAHVGLVRQFEEGDDIAPAAIQKDMHIRVIFARGRHMVLGKGCGERHAQDVGIPVHSRLGVLAAIGDVVDPFEFHGRSHATGSTTCSAPRSIWSRSMLLNKAVKLPSPKPSSFLR